MKLFPEQPENRRHPASRPGLLPGVSVFSLALLILLSAFVTPVRSSEDMSITKLGADPASIEKLLKEGEIMIIKEDEKGERFKYLTAGVFIEAPPEKVWETITDYEHYPEFVPDCEKVEVTPGEAENVHFTRITVAFKFSIIKYKIRYTLRQVHQKNRWRIDWTLKEGDLAEAIGSWELIPLEGGKATAAFYTAYSDLRSLGYLVRFMFKEQPVMELAIMSSTVILMGRATKARVEGKELK